MHFETDHFYHVYNRCNEKLFYSRDNYIYFLKKIKKNLLPYSNILAWCLMPNHFHLLLQANETGALSAGEKHRPSTQNLSKAIGTVLSSYTYAINKQECRRGSLFAHNTEAKDLDDPSGRYLGTCFFYIHQNPYAAGLVDKPEGWEFSSLWDYIGLRNEGFVNKALALEVINFDKDNLLQQTSLLLKPKEVDGIF